MNFKTSSQKYYNISFFWTELETFEFIGGVDDCTINHTSMYETALRSGP